MREENNFFLSFLREGIVASITIVFESKIQRVKKKIIEEKMVNSFNYSLIIYAPKNYRFI